jgi:hypothetical protein
MKHVCALALCLAGLIPASRTTPDVVPGQRTAASLGITVFADADYRGTSATFREDTQDLRPFGLTDKVTSLRVAPGEAWEACEHINYEGRCQVFTGNHADLRPTRWSDIISSVRRVKDADVPRGRGRDIPRLILFDARDFRGGSIEIDQTSPQLRGFSNRAGSARVLSGRWELCERASFRGRCVIVNADVADLGRVGLSNEVSSARPVR